MYDSSAFVILRVCTLEFLRRSDPISGYYLTFMTYLTCTECGTELIDVTVCKEYFDRMIAWDFADFEGVGRVHHLTVLCYYLQHPSHYSREGLSRAIRILKKVTEHNLSDTELYQEESAVFSSSQRNWSVTGTPEDHGAYSPPIRWSMTVSSVVKDGMKKYPDHVTEWSGSIYSDLQKAHQLEL